MQNARLQQLTPVSIIFDVEDRYARDRAVRGKHPRPITPIRYFLLGKMVGQTRQDFDEPIELLVKRNPGGYDLFFNKIQYENGSRYRDELQEGMYVLWVTSPYYQQHVFEDLPVPSSTIPYRIDLEPGYGYPFPVSGLGNAGSPTLLRGVIHHPDGQGVEGATLEVTGRSNTYVTDATGQWLLVFPDDDPGGLVTVTSRIGGNITNITNVLIETGSDSSLTQTALRGFVRNAANVGIAGATVNVGGYPSQTTTAADGSWFFYFGLDQADDVVSVTAQISDGPSLTQSNIQVQSREIVVVPNFQFT